MATPRLSAESLYVALAELAPVGRTRGETLVTRQKETLDNDTEAFDFDLEPNPRGD